MSYFEYGMQREKAQIWRNVNDTFKNDDPWGSNLTATCQNNNISFWDFCFNLNLRTQTDGELCFYTVASNDVLWPRLFDFNFF